MQSELNNPLVRQQILRTRVEQGKTLVATLLSEEFSVSLDTIRRDLLALEDIGAITRVRGGGIPVRQPSPAMHHRLGQDQGAASKIAAAAVSQIEDGMVLLFDGGTTTLALAQMLPPLKHSLVVTPAPSIASLTMERGTETILIGGRLSPSGGIAVGSVAEDAIRRVAADICFLGACGLDEVTGIGADDFDECGVKRSMMHASANVCVLAGSDKIGERARHSVAPVEDIHRLVTDAKPETCRGLQAMGVEVVYV